jgi:hypothetical protein
MSQSNKIFAVIHLINESNISIEQRTIDQVTIAFDNNIDGVFLIPAEGGMSLDIIISCYQAVRNKYADKFIGINFMAPIDHIIKIMPHTIDGLWTDHGIGVKSDIEKIIKLRSFLDTIKWEGLLFAGFFFKGNNSKIPSNELLSESARTLVKYADVLTTSGECTGVSIDIKTLSIISNASYDVQNDRKNDSKISICVASGVTYDNILSMTKYSNYFMVGTGIEEDAGDPDIIKFYKEAGLPSAVNIGYLDGKKIRKIVDAVKSTK